MVKSVMIFYEKSSPSFYRNVLIFINMKSIDVYRAVRDAGFSNAQIVISDIDYALPKTDWLTGKFYSFYQSWRADHNLNEWTMKNDCDNFASLYYAFAQICHAKSNRSEQGIAVGELFYFVGADKEQGHAINIVITEKGVITIEPQNGNVQRLTADEKASSWFIRF